MLEPYNKHLSLLISLVWLYGGSIALSPWQSMDLATAAWSVLCQGLAGDTFPVYWLVRSRIRSAHLQNPRFPPGATWTFSPAWSMATVCTWSAETTVRRMRYLPGVAPPRLPWKPPIRKKTCRKENKSDPWLHKFINTSLHTVTVIY